MSGDGPVIPQVFYPDGDESPPRVPEKYVMKINWRLESSANLREHWRARAARARVTREMAWALCRVQPWMEYPAELRVTLKRVAPSAGLDDDNLAAAFKAVRDGIADKLGLRSDRDPRVSWRYEQARGKWAVEVAIERV